MKWGVRKTFQARSRYGKARKAGNIKRSQRVEDQYAKKVKDFETKWENIYSKSYKDGTREGSKLEGRYESEREKLMKRGEIATKKARLLDAGYSEKEAQIGAEWASRRRWTIGKYDEGWKYRYML